MKKCKQKINDFSKIKTKSGKLKCSTPDFFSYQEAIPVCGSAEYIIKCRQSGISYRQAWCALYAAAVLGRNQVLVSASKRQVNILYTYAKMFAHEHFGVELRGKDQSSIITASGGTAHLFWCSNSALTAQGWAGDVRMDEFPQNPKAEEVFHAILPCSTTGDYNITLFGAVSTDDSFAYRLWAGKDERGNPLDLGFNKTKITIDTAIAGGNTLISKQKIQRFYPQNSPEYKKWFLCEWQSTQDSIFSKEVICNCFLTNKQGELMDQVRYEPDQIDSVLFGYDPNGGGTQGHHQAGFLFVAHMKSGEYHVLEQMLFRSQESLPEQFRIIRQRLSKYGEKLSFVAMDRGGPGGVMAAKFEELQQEHPRVEFFYHEFNYGTKNGAGWHLYNLISKGIIKFCYNNKQLISALYSVKLKTTAGGRATLRSTEQSGSHGELFWALALIGNAIEDGANGRSSATISSFLGL